jgi:hypothetical protein
MEVLFDKTKLCEIYQNLVLNRSNRKAQIDFYKKFNKIDKQAIRIYDRLILAKNGKAYNEMSGSDNKIELKLGCKDNDPQEFKIRINKAFRKFFRYVLSSEEYCLKKDWDGRFEEIKRIFVIDINNHDYS